MLIVYKGHRLRLDDLQSASGALERERIRRQLVAKGSRRFWFCVITLALEWQLLTGVGMWAALFLLGAACVLGFVLYAMTDF